MKYSLRLWRCRDRFARRLVRLALHVIDSLTDITVGRAADQSFYKFLPRLGVVNSCHSDHGVVADGKLGRPNFLLKGGREREDLEHAAYPALVLTDKTS